MRLLYLMTEPFGVGGVQSDILTLTEDLGRRGHVVHLATTEGVLLDEVKARGARHIDIDFAFRGVRGAWRAILALRKAIREHRIELLAPQSVRSTLIAFLATRLLPFGYRPGPDGRRLPIVTTIHNIHSPRHFAYVGWILRCCCDFVIFESHYERDRVLAGGLDARRSTVIHSGIDTERFVPRPVDPELARQFGIEVGHDFVYGIVARLSEEKGHVYLLDAFAALRREVDRARLLIVGDGPLLAQLKQQAAALGIEKDVVFAGLQRDIPRFLAMMDVFVLASTRESFPLAAREAMAAGKAVVAPRIGGCPEVVDEGVTGYLFESRDVEGLAERLRAIAQDGRWREFGRQARARVERLFSRQAWVEGDEKVYRSYADRA